MPYYFSPTNYLTSENARYDITEAMFESIRDLLTVKITVPIGNPNLKQMHTNQFIGCTLQQLLPLDNFDIIAKRMNSTYSRYAGYQPNRWYIEGVNINVDSKGKATMELELNPFASSKSKYWDNYTKYGKAYQDAIKQSENNNEGGAGGGNETKSTGNSTLPGGQGDLIDNLVREICGNITDELEKAKAIHGWLQKNVRYSRYCCAKYKTVEECYNNRSHLNCADTATLTCAMMRSAGLNAYIVHRTYNGGHFWTLIEINGRTYASDQTGNGSAFNTVWSNSGRANTSITSYSRKNGNFPDCYPAYSC